MSASWRWACNTGHTASSSAWAGAVETLQASAGWPDQMAAAALLKLLPCCDGCCEGKEASRGFGDAAGRGQALLKYVQQGRALAYCCCRLNLSDTNDRSRLSQATSAFLWDELGSLCSGKTLAVLSWE